MEAKRRELSETDEGRLLGWHCMSRGIRYHFMIETFWTEDDNIRNGGTQRNLHAQRQQNIWEEWQESQKKRNWFVWHPFVQCQNDSPGSAFGWAIYFWLSLFVRHVEIHRFLFLSLSTSLKAIQHPANAGLCSASQSQLKMGCCTQNLKFKSSLSQLEAGWWGCETSPQLPSGEGQPTHWSGKCKLWLASWAQDSWSGEKSGVVSKRSTLGWWVAHSCSSQSHLL
jgi:hypothetical protein